MSRPAPKAKPATPKAKPKAKPIRFPWLPLLILLATVYVFWILPIQQGSKPTKVTFTKGN